MQVIIIHDSNFEFITRGSTTNNLKFSPHVSSAYIFESKDSADHFMNMVARFYDTSDLKMKILSD